MKGLNFFKALADETRLRIYRLLLEHELSVNEIVAVLDMGQSRISRHLKILAESGLLLARRDGLWVFYRGAQVDENGRLPALVREFCGGESIYAQDMERAMGLLRDRSNSTKRFFNAIAGSWDMLKKDIYGELDLPRLVMRKVPACGVAVDLGCGTGELIELLKEKARLVIGIDSSPRMIEEARKRFSGRVDGVDLRLGEIEHVPVGDNEADVAVAVMALHHLSAPDRGIREAWRVLKQGSILIVSELDKHADEAMRDRFGDRWLGFEREQVEGWLESAGFSITEYGRHELRRLAMNLFVAEKTGTH